MVNKTFLLSVLSVFATKANLFTVHNGFSNKRKVLDQYDVFLYLYLERTVLTTIILVFDLRKS